MPAAKTGADSARRAIDMLFAFEQKATASVRELAETVGIPVPSAHRYVAMLRDMGLVEEAGHGRHRLTMRVAALGHAARRATSLIDVVQPIMQGLSDLVHETVILVQPVSGLPVCTHRVEAQRMVRLSFEVGQYLPPLRGASAHLLAGHLSEAARRDYVEGAVERGERAPVGGIETFLADSARDAERGWSESHEEIDEGIWSAAAAIRSAGDFVGTLSVPCPQFRVDDRHRDEVIAAVREAAAQVSSALGS